LRKKWKTKETGGVEKSEEKGCQEEGREKTREVKLPRNGFEKERSILGALFLLKTRAGAAAQEHAKKHEVENPASIVLN